jgi:hypothetical protein
MAIVHVAMDVNEGEIIKCNNCNEFVANDIVWLEIPCDEERRIQQGVGVANAWCDKCYKMEDE